MIEVMISSTISDLRSEREVVKKALEDKFGDLITLVGAEPIQHFAPGCPAYMESKRIAATCDIYVLIIGKRFGYRLEDGISATELEFDAAFENDRTEIIVLALKDFETQDPDQLAFYDKIRDYYKGYWLCFYDGLDDLGNKCTGMVNNFLDYSISSRNSLDLLDKFVAVVKTHSTSLNNELSYSKKEDMVEISKTEFGQFHAIHFSKEDISRDFWGCVGQALTGLKGV